MAKYSLATLISKIPLPGDLRSYEVLKIDGWIYILGGVNSQGSVSSKIWGLNLSTAVPSSWVRCGRLHRPLFDFKAFYCQERKILYTFGGRFNFGSRTMHETRIQKYSLEGSTEFKHIGYCPTEMPIAISKFGFRVDVSPQFGRRTESPNIYIFGGFVNGYGTTEKCFKHTLGEIDDMGDVARPWNELEPLPKPLADPSVLMIKDCFYLFGGGNYDNLQYQSLSDTLHHYRLNASAESGLWSTESNWLRSRYYTDAVLVDGDICFITDPEDPSICNDGGKVGGHAIPFGRIINWSKKDKSFLVFPSSFDRLAGNERNRSSHVFHDHFFYAQVEPRDKTRSSRPDKSKIALSTMDVEASKDVTD